MTLQPIHDSAQTLSLSDLQVDSWLQAPADFSLSGLQGSIVLVHTFQMLCPGCVLHAIPQVARLISLDIPELVIVGLHTVFEHHQVMTESALSVFLSEYRLNHQVGIDTRSPGDPIPQTMRRFALRGTPSILLFDRCGRLRGQHFGSIDDLSLGCHLGALLAEDHAPRVDTTTPATETSTGRCTLENCRTP